MRIRMTALLAAATICVLATCSRAHAQGGLPMPDFVAEGATFEQARQTLLKRYHRIPEKPQFGPSDLPAGRIFAQQPPAGTDLRSGEPIIFQVADGTAPPGVGAEITQIPSADVSVTVGLQTTGPFAPGAELQFVILVTNAGPSTASHVQVVATAPNLAFTDISGACTALPCEIASLEAKTTATIDAVARIKEAGSFEMALTVKAAESDPDGANNFATSGTFPASTPETVPAEDEGQPVITPGSDAPVPVRRPPSIPWWQRFPGIQLSSWLVAVLAVLAFIAATVTSVRRASWRGRVTVSASLARDGDSSVSPLTITTPPVGLQIHLEPGHAAPLGPVPVIRIEVSRG